jgi:nucleoside 2-deoxyribosyltransferase
MKIYFSGSIRGGRENRDIYSEIIKELHKYGSVLTEHVGFKNLSVIGEVNMPVAEIYKRDMDWLVESDIVIAEVTTPSLGVGYEIGQAEALKKPIYCFYHVEGDSSLSAMIEGNPNVKLYKYGTVEDVVGILKEGLGNNK